VSEHWEIVTTVSRAATEVMLGATKTTVSNYKPQTINYKTNIMSAFTADSGYFLRDFLLGNGVVTSNGVERHEGNSYGWMMITTGPGGCVEGFLHSRLAGTHNPAVSAWPW